MRKASKRRPYQPKNPGTTLVDTIMAASREDVQQEDLDLLITPALAQLVSIEDFGTITAEGFVLLNEANCLVYALAKLLFEGSRCDHVVKVKLHGLCQEAVDKAEAAASVLADMAERFKQSQDQEKGIAATVEDLSVIKAAVHMMPTLSSLANRGAFFKAMKDAQHMIDLALEVPKDGKGTA